MGVFDDPKYWSPAPAAGAANPFDDPKYSTPDEAPIQADPNASLWNSVPRGAHEVLSGVDVLKYGFGQSDAPEFAQSLVDNEAAIAANPKTEAELALQKNFTIPGLFSNPTAIPGVLGESLAGLGLVGGSAVAGGFVGGPPGAIAGLGVGGAASTFGSAFKDYLRQQGVDFKNKTSVELFLSDPDLVNEAYWYAAGQAGVSGVLNAVAGGIGGRVATRFFVQGATKGEIAKGAAATIGVGAAAGGATDIASSVVGGRPVDLGSAGANTVIGGAMSAPFAVPGLVGRRGATVENTPPRPEDILRTTTAAAEEGPPGSPPPSPPAAPLPVTPQAPRPGAVPGAPRDGEIIPPPRREAPLPPAETQPRTIPGDPGPPPFPPAVQGGRRQHVEVEKEYRAVINHFWEKYGQAIEDNTIRVQDAWAQEPRLVARLNQLKEEWTTARTAEMPIPPWELDASRNHWNDPSFINWFRGSQARNADGTPLVLYHGTLEPGGIAVFHEGTHFGTAKAANERVADVATWPNATRNIVMPTKETQAPNMVPVYVRAEKPFMVGDLGDWSPHDWAMALQVRERSRGYSHDAGEFTQQEINNVATGMDPIPLLKAKGYDSISYTNSFEDPGSRSWIVFDPQQVKSAIGNRGTYDPNNRHILLSANEKPFGKGEVRVDRASAEEVFNGPEWTKLVPAVERSLLILRELTKRFGIPGLKVMFGYDTGNMPLPDGTMQRAYGHMQRSVDGVYTIRVSVNQHLSPEQIYATIMHEFGHVVMYAKFHSSPESVRTAIFDLYQEFVKKISFPTDIPTAYRERSNPVYAQMMEDLYSRAEGIPAGRIPNAEYLWGFNEWFAERVSRWAQTSDRALNVVDRFFHSLGRRMRELVATFGAKVGINFAAKDAFTHWMDSYMEAATGQTARDWFSMWRKQEDQNSTDLGIKGGGTPNTPAGDSVRGIGKNIFGDNPPPEFRKGAAAVDRFNWVYKYALGIWQVAARNRGVRSLQLYHETVQQMHQEIVQLMTKAGDTLKAWRNLGQVHMHKLTLLIDDYMNMRYLTPAERQKGVRRKPNPTELQQMIADHGVSAQGLEVFVRIVKDFEDMLESVRGVLYREADKITDPVASAARLQEIDTQIAAMKKSPYFPALRFGQYTLAIRDSQGNVVHFEQFETKAQRAAAAQMAKAGLYAEHMGFKHYLGVMPEEVMPFVGLPPGLLNMLAEKLDLSKAQRAAMDELKFELAPGQSFKHRFQRKRLVSGYSQDFMRAYGNYFFHGANYLGRAKWADNLRQYVKDTHEQAKFMPDGTKRGQIANYMEEHLGNNVLDSKADFVKLKAIIFHYALGFSPAAAAVNLTQLLVGTAPFLTAKFGTFRGLGAITNAGRRFNTYYRKGTLENMTDVDLRALSRAVRDGIVSEAMAPELAGIAEGRNLGKRFGTTSEAIVEQVKKASAFLFQTTEQINRRITFRAAYDLAKQNVNHPHVLETLRANELLYEKLMSEQWQHQDAAAYIVAKDAVESTQFVYASWARPRIFRGKLGSIFMFKSFLQNTMFMLFNHPDVAWRSVLVMGALGGLMGIPGTEDLADWLKLIGTRLFGADFDLDREVRKFVLDVTDGTVPPDMVLHGAARHGFGIPATLSMLGVHIPEFDLSRSMGIGALNPVPLSPLLGNVQDPETAIAQSAQKASGAAFGTGFNFYKAVFDAQLSPTDFKRWERVLPRWLANIGQAGRVAKEGGERTTTGAQIVKFNVDNPTNVAEMIGMAMGFKPTRLTGEWDRIRAKAEVAMFWDIRRQDLLKQFDWARQAEDPRAMDGVIQAITKYNNELPEEIGAKSISREDLKASAQTRERNRALLEQGVSPQKSNRGIGVMVDKLYPEVEVNRQVVK